MNINTIFFVYFRIHSYKSIKTGCSKTITACFHSHIGRVLYIYSCFMYIYTPFCISFLYFFFILLFYSPYRIFFFPFDLVLWYILFDVIIRKGAHAVVNRQGQIKQRKDRYCPGAFAKAHITVKKYRNIDCFEKHSGPRFL